MSRKQIYLTFINSKLNGENISFPTDLTPKTKVEEYLYGISLLLQGQQHTLPLDLIPKTKEELFLEWLYDTCTNINSTNSNDKKLELIDKVLVRVKPILKLNNLTEYHILTSNVNLNNLQHMSSVNVIKKGIIKLKDLSERVEYENINFNNLTLKTNTCNIIVQHPINITCYNHHTLTNANIKSGSNRDSVKVLFV